MARFSADGALLIRPTQRKLKSLWCAVI